LIFRELKPLKGPKLDPQKKKKKKKKLIESCGK